MQTLRASQFSSRQLGRGSLVPQRSPVAASASSRDGPLSGPPPPKVVADESTRACLANTVNAEALKQEYLIMRGPHGPGLPLSGGVELLGDDCGHRQGVVRRIHLKDGGSIILRPQLKGPVHPTIITKAHFKWQGKQQRS